MTKIFTKLKLSELSLVDNPANPLAMAPIYKRNSQKGEKDMPEMVEIEKSVLKATKEKIDNIEAIESENQMLKSALIENGFVIKADSVEKKAEPEYITVDGEQINKADIPAPVLKKMEADAAEIEAAEVAKRELEVEKKATESFPHVKKEHAVKLFKNFEDDKELMEFLASVDALFESHMEETGKASTSEDLMDSDEKLESLIKAHMEENKMKKSEYALAYAAVSKTAEGKALIQESYKEGDS